MKVQLLTHTPDVEKIIAASAKLCYSDSTVDNLMNGLTTSKTIDFITRLSDIGHESPIEHVSFTFAIEGVSRTLMAQITRHRIASFSVQSQRYIHFDKGEYVTPPAVKDGSRIEEFYNESIHKSIEAYQKLSEMLYDKWIHDEEFIRMHPNDLNSAADKRAIEDARFLLPNAFCTNMIVTMNARSLMNFFKLRCCNRAQWEIREVAKQMLALCYSVAPTLFRNAGPSCVHGHCSEGRMSCRKMNLVKTQISALKLQAMDAHLDNKLRSNLVYEESAGDVK